MKLFQAQTRHNISGAFKLNLAHFLLKIGQPLCWSYFTAGFDHVYFIF
jgi:hypothetical protein